MKKSKFWAMFFSAIPGAGHMYLGLLQQGLQLMGIFFFTIFFVDWLRLSVLMFLLPIFWFYSVFDVLKKTSGEEPLEDGDVLFVSWLRGQYNWKRDNNRLLGYGLIAVGLVLSFDRVFMPLLRMYMPGMAPRYVQTGIVAVLFILGGIKLIIGSKKESREEKGIDEPCDSGE